MKNLLYLTAGVVLAIFGGFISNSLDAQSRERGEVGIFEKVICKEIEIMGDTTLIKLKKGNVTLSKYDAPGSIEIVSTNKLSYNGMFPVDNTGSESFFTASGFTAKHKNNKATIVANVYSDKETRALGLGYGSRAQITTQNLSGTCIVKAGEGSGSSEMYIYDSLANVIGRVK